jgi:hypothetical protein
MLLGVVRTRLLSTATYGLVALLTTAGALGLSVLGSLWAWKLLATAALIDWCEVTGRRLDYFTASGWDDRFTRLARVLGSVLLLSRRARFIDSPILKWLAVCAVGVVWIVIMVASLLAPGEVWTGPGLP